MTVVPGERTLELTPTWALATVSTIFVVISFVVERSLHGLGHYLVKTKRKSLSHALQKMKDELMLLGFISVTLAILQDPISKICVRSSILNTWTPCKITKLVHDEEGSKKFFQWGPADFTSAEGQHGRRRLLATESRGVCSEDYEPFVSSTGLHQLHIFVFVLAGAHVVYSCITMALALAKVHSWRKWETEFREAAASTNGFAELLNNSIGYSRQSTFIKYHASKPWSRSRFIVWVVCFFQQFHIPRVDYLTLRTSFISTHNLPYKYNFHAYMIRCMEDEFEKIVGISAWLWAFVISFLLFNTQGVNLYFWSSFAPIVIVLVIGMKLQHIVATLALETDRAVPGPFVGVMLNPRDQLFWFNRPKLILDVIHLVLFQNAFELATFVWQVWQFGIHSCLLEKNKVFVIVRLVIGLVVQLSCSFSTLPLYALVSQMGTNYKKAVMPLRVNRVLHLWHKDAKKRLKIPFGSSERSENSRGKHTRDDRILDRIKDVQDLSQKDEIDASSVSSGSGSLSPSVNSMEEGSLNRNANTLQPVSTSPTTTGQNAWNRRFSRSTSGKRKPLNSIVEELALIDSQTEHEVAPELEIRPWSSTGVPPLTSPKPQ